MSETLKDNFIQEIGSLHADKSFSDVEIVLFDPRIESEGDALEYRKDRRIRAHRCILAVRSPVFRRYLAKVHAIEKTHLPLNDFPPREKDLAFQSTSLLQEPSLGNVHAEDAKSAKSIDTDFETISFPSPTMAISPNSNIMIEDLEWENNEETGEPKETSKKEENVENLNKENATHNSPQLKIDYHQALETNSAIRTAKQNHNMIIQFLTIQLNHVIGKYPPHLPEDSIIISWKVIYIYLYTGVVNWPMITEASTLIAFIFLVKSLELRALFQATLQRLEHTLTTSNAVALLNQFCQMTQYSEEDRDLTKKIDLPYADMASICFHYMHQRDALSEKQSTLFNMDCMSLQALQFYLQKLKKELHSAREGECAQGRHRITEETPETKTIRFIKRWISSQPSDSNTFDEFFFDVDLSNVGPKVLIEEVKPLGLFSQRRIYDAMEKIMQDIVKENETPSRAVAVPLETNSEAAQDARTRSSNPVTLKWWFKTTLPISQRQ